MINLRLPPASKVWMRLLWLLVVVGVTLIYFPINQNISGGIRTATPFDRYILLWPIWIVPYLGFNIWWIAAGVWAAIKMDEKRFQTFAIAALIVTLSSYLVFIYFPTYVHRYPPTEEGWLNDLVRWVYLRDKDYNALPSGHTYNTTLIALFWWNWKPKYRWLWGLSVPMVILATLFTKQHYLLDPVFGVLWAVASYYLARSITKWGPEEELMSWRDRIWRGLWLGGIFHALFFFLIYANLPVDGLSGGPSSFSQQGFVLTRVVAERPGGLSVDDIVVRAGGHSYEEWLDRDIKAGPTWEQGGKVAYEIIREGVRQTVWIEMQPVSLLEVLSHWWVQLSGGVALAVMSSYVYLKRPDYAPARWFMVFGMAFLIQQVGDAWNFQYAALVRPAYFWFHYVSEYVSYSLMFIAALQEVLYFPIPQFPVKRQGRLVLVGMVLVLLVPTFGVIFLTDSWFMGLNLSDQVNIAIVTLYLLITAGVLIRSFRRTTDLVAREQIKLFLFVVSVASGLGIPLHFLPVILTGVPILPPAISSAIALSLPVAFAIAILGVRLFEIDFIINRSVVYGILTVILASILGGVLLLINLVFTAMAGGQQSVIAAAVSAAIFGLMFQPTRRRVQRFVDRYVYDIAIDYERIIEKQKLIRQSPFEEAYGFPLSEFERVALLGTGGMSVVYRARHPKFKEDVAVKFLPFNLAADPGFRARFEREASTLSVLDNPGVVKVYDFGEENGIPYMVMEFLDGRLMSDYLKEKGPLSLGDTCLLFEGIVPTLDYIHDQGLVHRDVKPANFMLETAHVQSEELDFRPVIFDFGIAKVGSGESTRITFTGLLGSFDYIAPEQIQASEDVDRRADVYSLGVMAFRTLTGQLPFGYRNAAAMLMAHLQQQPPNPRQKNPKLSTSTAEVILKALAKQPENRYASAGEFFEALKYTWVTGE